MTFKRKFYALLFFKQCDRILKMFNQSKYSHFDNPIRLLKIRIA